MYVWLIIAPTSFGQNSCPSSGS